MICPVDNCGKTDCVEHKWNMKRVQKEHGHWWKRGLRVSYTGALGIKYVGNLTGRACVNPRIGDAHLIVKLDDGGRVSLPPSYLRVEEHLMAKALAKSRR